MAFCSHLLCVLLPFQYCPSYKCNFSVNKTKASMWYWYRIENVVECQSVLNIDYKEIINSRRKQIYFHLNNNVGMLSFSRCYSSCRKCGQRHWRVIYIWWDVHQRISTKRFYCQMVRRWVVFCNCCMRLLQ